MADHRISLPNNFAPVLAIEPGRSRTRHVAAALANIQEIIQPGSSANYQSLVSQIYEEATKEPDIPANTIGMSKADVLAYLDNRGIAYIDMSSAYANIIDLKREMQAQNLAGVMQLLILADESKLSYGTTGVPLHNWSAQAPATGSASMLRIGYSDDVATADYLDSDLPPNFTQPVPVSFDSIEAAGLLGVIAILPAGVTAPPADFRYFTGTTGPDGTGTLLPPNQWPVPEPPQPVIDLTQAQAILQEWQNAEITANQSRAAIFSRLASLLQQPIVASPTTPDVSAATASSVSAGALPVADGQAPVTPFVYQPQATIPIAARPIVAGN
jgi:hypothetical protein